MAIMPTAPVGAAANATSGQTQSSLLATVQSQSGGLLNLKLGSQMLSLESQAHLPVGAMVALKRFGRQAYQVRTLTLVQNLTNSSVFKNIEQGVSKNSSMLMELMINSRGQLVPKGGGKPIAEGLSGQQPGPILGRVETQGGKPSLALYRPGDVKNLSIPTSTQAASATPVMTQSLSPGLLELLGARPELAPILAALGRRIGDTQEQTTLNSLARLADPSMLRALMGASPLASGPALPLLLKLWYQLQGRAAQAGQGSTTLNALPDELKALLGGKAAEMLTGASEFHRHSQADGDNLILYYALPYEQERVQRELQLALARYKEKQGEFWLLTLRFELSLGHLLVRARYQDESLQLAMVSDSRALAHQVDDRIEALGERLTQQGLSTSFNRCQVGEVPDSIAQPARKMTYGAMGR
ncbi:hypothetical protein F0521_11010 [Ferrimonas sp. YFM]|nr:hypothetical protein F0521_11010 [Ferrimonas sp. YFM]